MIKKILGAMLVAVFAGVPLFAMANPCVYGDADYDVVACAYSGGTPSTPPPVNTSCTASDYANNTCASAPDNVQVPPSGSAQDNIQVKSSANFGANIRIQDPIKYSTFSAFAAAVTKTAVQVLMPFIVLAFIYSGFLFVKAQGNDTGLTEAKKVLWYSMIGAFILLGAWGFAQIIGQTVSTITQ